jgi:hypothetical protein
MKLSVTTATPYSKLTPPIPGRCTSNFNIDPNTGSVRNIHRGAGANAASSSSEDDDDDDRLHGGSLHPPPHHTSGRPSGVSAPSMTSLGPSSHHHGASPLTSARGALHGHLATEPSGETLYHTLGLGLTPCPFLRPKIMTVGMRCAPTASSNGTMSAFFDEGKIVLFGGNEGVRALNETWVYRIADRKWNFVDPMEVVAPALTASRSERGYTGDRLPPPRCGHSAVAIRDVPNAQKVDPMSLKAIPSAIPSQTKLSNSASASKKNNNAAQVLSYEPSVLVFGGADLAKGLYFNDLWLFDVELTAWKELKPGGTPPCERWHHGTCMLEQRMFVYGGESSEFQILDDLHMYDHQLGSWRPLRATQPTPPARMLHACCLSGEDMVIVGGIGSQAQNVALLDIAVDQGVHLAGSGKNGAGGKRRDSTSFRRPSEMDIESAAAAQQALASQPLKMSALAASFKSELSDVWVLNLRTLLWRRVADTQKRFSPFVVREDALLRGAAISVDGIASGPQLPPPYGGEGAVLDLKALEGHCALSFDERVLVMGGKLGGRLNRRLFSLHLPSETWAYLGELPANMSSDQLRLPLARSALVATTMVEKRTIASMRDAVSLASLETAHRHINELAEADPLVKTLATQLASQVSFTGALSIYGVQPVVSKTVCAYIFGGIGMSGKALSDTWCIELKDSTADIAHEELFGHPIELLLQGQQGASARSAIAAIGTASPTTSDYSDDDECERKRQQDIVSYVLGPQGGAAGGDGSVTLSDEAGHHLQRNRSNVGGSGAGGGTSMSGKLGGTSVASTTRRGLLSGTSMTLLDGAPEHVGPPHGRNSGSKMVGRRGSRTSESR